jgi:phosphate transport system protein
MTSRSGYHADLARVQQRLLHLAEAVDRAIISAQRALLTHDMVEAQQIITADLLIDRLRVELEDEVHRLFVQQSSLLGADLRAATSTLILAAELERIGDYAKGIAAIIVRSADLAPQELPPSLSQIAYKAREMLQQAIRAVIKRDPTTVHRLRKADMLVDISYQLLQQSALALLRVTPEGSERVTYLLWIAHNFERIADRSVNIAARAAFIATGAVPTTQEHPVASSDPASADFVGAP